MCGIFGVIQKRELSDYRQRALLITLNTDRGTDASGFLYSTTKGGFEYQKSAESAIKKIKPLKQKNICSDIFLGHTRRSSDFANARFDSCAHPFYSPDRMIFGAHNGFWSNATDIIRTLKKDGKYKEVEDFDVDSQVAVFLYYTFGPAGLKDLSGRGSMWFWDGNKDIIHLWCWKNPLSLSVDKDCIAFSSERDHLDICGFRNIRTLQENGTLIEIDYVNNKIKQLKNIKAKHYLSKPAIIDNQYQDEFGYWYQHGGNAPPAHTKTTIVYTKGADGSIEREESGNRFGGDIKDNKDYKLCKDLVLESFVAETYCHSCGKIFFGNDALDPRIHNQAHIQRIIHLTPEIAKFLFKRSYDKLSIDQKVLLLAEIKEQDEESAIKFLGECWTEKLYGQQAD